MAIYQTPSQGLKQLRVLAVAEGSPDSEIESQCFGLISLTSLDFNGLRQNGRGIKQGAAQLPHFGAKSMRVVRDEAAGDALGMVGGVLAVLAQGRVPGCGDGSAGLMQGPDRAELRGGSWTSTRY